MHPTALDYGAASLLRHSDEEPGAQRAALTSHSGEHLPFVSVPFVGQTVGAMDKLAGLLFALRQPL